MNLPAPTISTIPPAELRNPVAVLPQNPALPDSRTILAATWPALARALDCYTQNTAEQFSRLAYDHVRAGLIRRTDRLRLTAAAENLGITSFDAQLLIACAIREWCLAHHNDQKNNHNPLPKKTPHTPNRLWPKLATLVTMALALDTLILWLWLG